MLEIINIKGDRNQSKIVTSKSTMLNIRAKILCEKRTVDTVSNCDYLIKSTPSSSFLLCIFLISTILPILGCIKDSPPEVVKPVLEYGEREPAFSSDGKFIAYSSEGEIWLLELATEENEYVTHGRLPDWSPDDKWIVYVWLGDIYKINVETKEIKQLSTWNDCYFPDWSPNGRRIALDTGHEDPKGAHMIWLMDANGTNFKDISIHGTGEWREPDWSPSGDKLVHIRYVAGVADAEIFIMDSTGENSVRLTNNNRQDDWPVWSPDGSRIAYVSQTNGYYNVFLINADGTNKIKITFEPESSNGYASCEPTWSPDGSQIVYARVEWFEDEQIIELVSHLWIMNADGSNKKQLTGKVF